jgi:hypothetical protein
MAFQTAKHISTETICPSESQQNGTAKLMNCTLIKAASTVLVASGLGKQWCFHAVRYQAYLHNIQYSSKTKSSPYVLMLNTKPGVSHLQEFGVEGWLHPRRSNVPILSSMLGYPANQQGYLVWSPSRGPTKVVVSNNAVFGSRCPRHRSIFCVQYTNFSRVILPKHFLLELCLRHSGPYVKRGAELLLHFALWFQRLSTLHPLRSAKRLARSRCRRDNSLTILGNFPDIIGIRQICLVFNTKRFVRQKLVFPKHSAESGTA